MSLALRRNFLLANFAGFDFEQFDEVALCKNEVM